ncbi:hypothetical protein SAMN05444392_10519 [Seinonella peptonophila]|uniref:HPr Serine kinase C-terminal domain-containing protein n=1 Tax=Seinonella peptonophila TaxID=112248 RepID=A0A1M4XIM8_9BACL|nr:hypothetical protein [Seinonella peptonophila]SHE93246.1 hypothetical protein SAMN05444392_10519 [Seinonella peptonophila]
MMSYQQLVKTFRLFEITYPYHVAYMFKGIVGRLYSNRQEVLDWSKKYFRPHYQSVELPQSVRPHFSVATWIEHELFIQMNHYLQEYLPQQLDQSFEEDIEFVNGSDGSILYDRKKMLFLICDQNFQQIFLVASPKSQGFIYEPARMVRELMTRYMERKGFFLLHAAAVEKDGKAILLCGDKGAGKTTMMLGLLAAGYNLISNDKVYVGIENRKVKIYTWPGPVGITMQTVFHYTALQQLIDRSEQLMFPQFRWDHDIYALGDIGLDDNEIHKIDLSVGETAQAFRRNFVREAELGLIMILDDLPLTENFQPVLQKEKAMEWLGNHFLFAKNDSNYPPSDPSYPYWYGLNNQSKKWIQLYQMTLKIIVHLSKIYRMSKTRVEPLEWKVHSLLQFIKQMYDQ